MNPEIEERSLTAAADVIEALDAARNISESLAEEELHAVCYFGRAVAAATTEVSTDEPAQLPYVFTYGANGGPFARAVQNALAMLQRHSWISVDVHLAGSG